MLNRFFTTALLALGASTFADEGMWLFTNPPTEAIKEKYGFDLTAEWLEHVQKSAVRFSTGGSGSIVSAEGLVMTNHHVASDILAKLSSAERDLLEHGFHAKTRAEELPAPDLELLVLWEVRDVTAEVQGAATPDMSPGEAGAARRSAMSRLESEFGAETGLKPELVTLYQGGRYHLYGYKRYTDVRLVFAPEKRAAFFGGDPDNFEYPRYCLDVTFLRIYENGQPLKPEHHLAWSADGVDAEELVFVAGHPGRTERLNTVAQLEYFRDVRYPEFLRRIWRREVQLQTFGQGGTEARRIAEDELFGIQNSRKAITGRLEGLNDPAIMDAKREAERALKAFVWSDAERAAKWGDAWEEIARAQEVAKKNSKLITAFGGGGSQLYSMARSLVRAAAERQKPSAERLREYSDAALPRLEQRLTSAVPIYPDLEVDTVRSWILWMAENLGGDHPLTVMALGGKAPTARAEELVLSSVLFDAEARKALFEGGQAAIDASDDAMLRLYRSIDERARALRKEMEDQVSSVEAAAYAKIAEAKFAKEGESVYPDATFTLRLSYGKVTGYEEGGKFVPPFTAIEGTYDRAREFGETDPFRVPDTWAAKEASLKTGTPYNFVSTNDIIGGNSGSPVVDSKGEVVGLIFDGNVQSLVGAMAYSESQARAVSVDSRGIVEALESVYEAVDLVNELRGAVPAN